MSSSGQQLVAVNQSGISPWQVIQTYSPSEWESFIVEWTEGFNPPYVQVVNFGGAGDKGRDVIAYRGDPTDPLSEWDCYQCKHYSHPLRPTDVYLELGKLCVYTQRGDYSVPRNYRFVAPHEVGPKLHDLLKKPDMLRRELISNWDDHCAGCISDSEQFPLDAKLKAYIENFNFNIVWFLTRKEIIDQHQGTKYWHRRFKVDPPVRPAAAPPPKHVQPSELTYAKCLFDAYADHIGKPVNSEDDIKDKPKIFEHFNRSRGNFYTAEALARFSRDNFSPMAFDEVKENIYHGVADITCQPHQDGFQCVIEVAKAAVSLPLPTNDIVPYVGSADKKGICHHLSNDGRLRWTQK